MSRGVPHASSCRPSDRMLERRPAARRFRQRYGGQSTASRARIARSRFTGAASERPAGLCHRPKLDARIHPPELKTPLLWN
jgi:hypothetical protein